MVDMWLETTLSKNHKADVIVDWRPKTTTQHCIVDTSVPAKVQGTQASHVSWPRGPIKEEVEYVSGTSAFEVSVRTRHRMPTVCLASTAYRLQSATYLHD